MVSQIHLLGTENNFLQGYLCCKVNPSYWSVLYLVKKNPKFLQRLVAILREYRRLRLTYNIQSTHVYTSKPSRDIPVWQMIRMDMKISRIVLTEKVNYLECEKGLRIRIITLLWEVGESECRIRSFINLNADRYYPYH